MKCLGSLTVHWFSHRLQVVGSLTKYMKIVVLVEALMQIILVQEHKDKNN